MFLLGILGLLQVGFLPGYLLVRWLCLDTRLLKTLSLSFGLSLVINYALALVLVSIGLFVPPVLYALFLLECGLLIWMIYPIFSQNLENLSARLLSAAGCLVETLRQPSRFFSRVVTLPRWSEWGKALFSL